MAFKIYFLIVLHLLRKALFKCKRRIGIKAYLQLLIKYKDNDSISMSRFSRLDSSVSCWSVIGYTCFLVGFVICLIFPMYSRSLLIWPRMSLINKISVKENLNKPLSKFIFRFVMVFILNSFSLATLKKLFCIILNVIFSTTCLLVCKLPEAKQWKIYVLRSTVI